LTGSTPYAFDADLDLLFATDTYGGTSHTANGPQQVLTTPIPVTGAMVIARDFDGDPVWIADQNRAIQVFGVSAFSTVSLGDRVSFTATALTNYFGELEVTGIDLVAGVTITSSGNTVYIANATNGPVDFDVTGARLVEFYGTVVGPTGQSCGSGTCYAIEHNGVTQRVNLPASFGIPPLPGDCMHFIAPVTWNWSDDRISVSNFDWVRFY
ncbi:MAG: hypothetical protein KC621_09950, partial [Myxococcales bacterium]|nr:hypothetical protein [Myxococcales bacterium]